MQQENRDNNGDHHERRKKKTAVSHHPLSRMHTHIPLITQILLLPSLFLPSDNRVLRSMFLSPSLMSFIPCQRIVVMKRSSIIPLIVFPTCLIRHLPSLSPFHGFNMWAPHPTDDYGETLSFLSLTEGKSEREHQTRIESEEGKNSWRWWRKKGCVSVASKRSEKATNKTQKEGERKIPTVFLVPHDKDSPEKSERWWKTSFPDQMYSVSRYSLTFSALSFSCNSRIRVVWSSNPLFRLCTPFTHLLPQSPSTSFLFLFYISSLNWIKKLSTRLHTSILDQFTLDWNQRHTWLG